MSDAVLIAVASTVFGLVIALVGVIWNLLNRRIEGIWDQVGRSPKEGMREVVHRTAGEQHGHGLEIHELKRRAEILERRVFNGYGVPR